MSSDSPNSFARVLQIAGRVFLGICTVIAFFTLIRLPFASYSTDLDPSWQEAFCYFATHRLQTGVDYIFTYGPLGYLVVNSYAPSLFLSRLIWEIVTKIFVIGVLLHIAKIRSISTCRTSGILIITILVFNHRALMSSDVFNYFCFIVFALLFLVDTRAARNLWLLIPIIGITSVLALVKLTLLPLCLLIVALATYQWVQQKKSKILSPFLFFAISWIALWLITGQSLRNLPAYIKGSLEIIDGYGKNMVNWGGGVIPMIPLYALVAVLGIAAFVVGTLPLFRRKTAEIQSPLPTLVLAGLTSLAVLFIAFKHGFVRADAHILVTFAILIQANALLVGFFLPSKEGVQAVHYAPLAATLVSLVTFSFLNQQLQNQFLLNLFPTAPKPNYQYSLKTEAATYLAGLFSNAVSPGLPAEALAKNPHHTLWNEVTDSVAQGALHGLLSINNFSESVKQVRIQAQKQFDIPRIRETVGKDTVDVWSYEQGIVLLYDMSYDPRPAFQGYSSYTSYLEETNAAFIRSDKAPRYILFKLQTIDNRFPTMDDGLALTEVLTRYRPLFTEKGYLLLQRKESASTPSTVAKTEKEVMMDTEILIPSSANTQLVSFDITPTLRAKLITALWKPKDVTMTIKRSDGFSFDYRILPQMVKTPFMLNPLLLDNKYTEDYLRTGKTPLRIVSIVLHNTPTAGGPFYKPAVTMRLIEQPNATP